MSAYSQTQSTKTARRRNGIIWLASYPKSGNTWFRIFLHNLQRGSEESLDLSELNKSIASDRRLFDDYSGLDSSDLTHNEIDSLRPSVYEQIVKQARNFPIFIKTHDAFSYLPNGESLLSQTATAGAIYFIRNPLDVAVSYAHHKGQTGFDQTIAAMGDADKDHSSDTKGTLQKQLRQKKFGWSGHIRSWQQTDVPVHFMRYEDMHQRPVQTFSDAVRFAGLTYDDRDIEEALARSSFSRLQKIEQLEGFREKPTKAKSFFRIGKVGGGRVELSAPQTQQIQADHGDLMRHWGYLSEKSD